MAPHSSTLAWKILWMKEPGSLQSMGLLRVRYDWATSLSLFTFMHWRRKWQPTPVFLPGESQRWGAWWAAVYGVAQSQTRLKWLNNFGFISLWSENAIRNLFFQELRFSFPHTTRSECCKRYLVTWKGSAWKYQWPQIYRWHHPYGRKWRGTKKPLDASERGRWKKLG